MGVFVKGDIVVIPFPFSDLSGNKRRPALVIAALPGEDGILCQITSRHKTDPLALSLEAADFASGGLLKIRHPWRILSLGFAAWPQTPPGRSPRHPCREPTRVTYWGMASGH